MAKVVNMCYEVYRNLGPFLLERAYQEALICELQLAGIPYECEKIIPILYKGKTISSAFRADIIVNNQIIIELKAVDKIIDAYHGQLATYMKLSRIPYGILVNFHAIILKEELFRKSLEDIELYQTQKRRTAFLDHFV